MTDRRARWENSPALKDDVVLEVRNWAAWSHGGWPNLDHKRKTNFAVDPSKAPPPCDVAKAERTEMVMRYWWADGDDGDAKLIRVLRLHFMTNKSSYTKAKIVGVGRRQFYRLVDEALFRLWSAGLDMKHVTVAHCNQAESEC